MNVFLRGIFPVITAVLSVVSMASISTTWTQESTTDYMAVIEQAQHASATDYTISTI